jgi:hypothetical protein
MSDSPAVIQFNSDGYELPILEGDAVGDVPGILSAGSDGTNYHIFKTDSDGSLATGEQHQLVTAKYDYIEMTYGGPPKRLLQTMTYKLGGIGGTIVATVTYTYDAYDNITSMART